jgi:hypothetical protein
LPYDLKDAQGTVLRYLERHASIETDGLFCSCSWSSVWARPLASRPVRFARISPCC